MNLSTAAKTSTLPALVRFSESDFMHSFSVIERMTIAETLTGDYDADFGEVVREGLTAMANTGETDVHTFFRAIVGR